MRARSMLGVALAVSLIALVVSTCVLTATAANSTGTTWKTATVKAADLALQYPSSWTQYPLTKKALAAQQRDVAKKNPHLALNSERQARFLRANAFWAADLKSAYAGRFLSNISVVKGRSGTLPADLASFTSMIMKNFQQVLGVTILNTSAVRIKGKQRPGESLNSYRVDLLASATKPDGSPVTGRVGQLYVPYKGGGADIVTITTTPDDAGVQLINRVLGSVSRI